MRTLAITQNITLDGSIEMLGDWFDPADQDPSWWRRRACRRSRRTPCCWAGRRSRTSGYWPQQTDDQTGITEELNQVQKYVVSSTMTDPQWQNSTVLCGDWLAQVRALKEREGRDIVVTGSITLSHALIEAGLVDEYRLFVYPTVQGRGRRLFPDGYEVPPCSSWRPSGFGNGVGYLRYAM